MQATALVVNSEIPSLSLPLCSFSVCAKEHVALTWSNPPDGRVQTFSRY